MKRTRETINYAHPNERWNLSSCLVFDGEDRSEEARRRHNAELQKQALLEQINENKRKKEMDREHEMMQDAQRMHLK
eukprot:CAMPEP_0170467900 /NCGR_PEP_ID=MMETSP0123-20130129/11299_1 /TAXON_ID=182087 /ORGANISM="Favella ehrenbergii, Strain Fehren 1" /LENGTH=76 /DNA_ID=CAMNT_0010734369 /DNA_START=15 /DNA_END=245 /DNA_ORIENTATION=-